MLSHSSTTNVKKDAQDEMLRTTREYLEACERYGDDPTPENEEAARQASAAAEMAAEYYAGVRRKIR